MEIIGLLLEANAFYPHPYKSVLSSSSHLLGGEPLLEMFDFFRDFYSYCNSGIIL